MEVDLDHLYLYLTSNFTVAVTSTSEVNISNSHFIQDRWSNFFMEVDLNLLWLYISNKNKARGPTFCMEVDLDTFGNSLKS